ncbi:FAD-dependent thymidylate synthase [Coleofasciculus sp. LEGE 07081]|uniref:FAD-dependent thymidylate synthase n=1 Tax=Coleofasciculus sp. LEGE 07081 TaxID=2777967 RepID=UPI00187E3E2E|nr:FAD-dependent thymidylate synthase [Coleofasciculus sp. LEGE 07081]MBE9128313.1 FAD-dependent thymidylate synthase [Coleofasciculus sp. LEGE 07081]
MKATLVSVRQSESARIAGAPQLTPELLAASGARYSRNNEGLHSILAKIDPDNLDKSVDSIFKMIDYGHQSIADMVPVAIFIDEISIWLAYLIWSQCPTAGGQESSTRYVKLSSDGVASPDMFGIPDAEIPRWREFLDESFSFYTEALGFWERVAEDRPEVMRIPQNLLDDPSDKTQKQVARMRRNFAFDRSRYFLPVCALTNMMLIMSARGWVQLCQYLLSHYHPEAIELGKLIAEQLQLEAPRMMRHVASQPGTVAGLKDELSNYSKICSRDQVKEFTIQAGSEPSVDLFLPPGISDDALCHALKHHSHRYAFIGEPCRSTLIRFGWERVSFAEIRDLNRHRTGTKYCPLVPVGFYVGQDEAHRLGLNLPPEFSKFGIDQLAKSRELLSKMNVSYVSHLLLGHEFKFDHSTTFDKFVYEAELRTGTGAHYRYAKHLRDAVLRLSQMVPLTASKIQLGLAEPE